MFFCWILSVMHCWWCFTSDGRSVSGLRMCFSLFKSLNKSLSRILLLYYNFPKLYTYVCATFLTAFQAAFAGGFNYPWKCSSCINNHILLYDYYIIISSSLILTSLLFGNFYFKYRNPNMLFMSYVISSTCHSGR